MVESNENLTNTGATETVESANKTYTQEEVDKLLQAETDRRVNMALEKQAKKNADKIKESEKLARMSESEKYEYQLSQREQLIAEKERQLYMAENRNEASKILADKGISLKLVDFVVDESADVMNDRIKLLDQEFKKAVRMEVEKRIGGNSPQSSTVSNGVITKEMFTKMTPFERQQLRNTDIDLYNSLTGR